MSKYFYDSFAFIEYFHGNVHYKPYFEEHIGITTIFNVAEVYYVVLNEMGKVMADEMLKTLLSYVIDVNGEIITKAMLFRHINKKRKLSYADCIGYEVARLRSVLFLTGDKEFKDLPNVMFLK